MAMQHIESKEGLGQFVEDPDKAKAGLAKVIVEAAKAWTASYPDIPFPSAAVPVVSQSVRAESQLVLPSLDKIVVIEQTVPEIAKTWAEKGFTNFHLFRLSAHQFERDGDYPDWNIKPQSWFWENVANGKISSNATKLEEMLVAVDRTQKPNYNKGRQLYPNDPFGDLLKQLRKEGKIQVPKELKHIPETSRFGISLDDLTSHVLPAIAQILEVDSSQVRLPKEIEFNVIGNIFHQEWGATTTLEWFEDNFGVHGHLVGGASDDGGLANVFSRWSDPPTGYDRLGFRPLVVLSPKA